MDSFQEDFDRSQVLMAAVDFNRYGAGVHPAGLRFAYHNHSRIVCPPLQRLLQTGNP